MIKVSRSRPLIEVKNLTIRIDSDSSHCTVVEDVSFTINTKTTVALVGRSGSGKTLTALSILGLLPKNVRITRGEIWFGGQDLITSSSALKNVRGNQISMIFQDPVAALNPVYSVGTQVADVIRAHHQVSSREAKARVLTLFEQTRLADSLRVFNSFPHQLSGGMAQRVMIAMALSCQPRLIIADEPTTALDVTTQMEILTLIRELQEEREFAMLMISHDLQAVKVIADSMIVMDKGRIVEAGITARLLNHPKSSSTERLVNEVVRLPHENIKQAESGVKDEAVV